MGSIRFGVLRGVLPVAENHPIPFRGKPFEYSPESEGRKQHRIPLSIPRDFNGLSLFGIGPRGLHREKEEMVGDMGEIVIRITTSRIGELLPKEFLALDVTRKTGMETLAPPWWMIRDYKSGKMPWVEYDGLYRQLMRRSQHDNPDVWKSLIEAGASGSIPCFQCYCKRTRHCHRHILAEMVKDYGEASGYEVRIIEE